jgi:hypothetical protein
VRRGIATKTALSVALLTHRCFFAGLLRRPRRPRLHARRVLGAHAATVSAHACLPVGSADAGAQVLYVLHGLLSVFVVVAVVCGVLYLAWRLALRVFVFCAAWSVEVTVSLALHVSLVSKQLRSLPWTLCVVHAITRDRLHPGCVPRAHVRQR